MRNSVRRFGFPFLVVALYASQSSLWAQDLDGYKRYQQSPSREVSFLYPAVLTENELETILATVKGLDDYEVYSVTYRPPDEIHLKTCRHGSEKPLRCDGGKMYIFRKTDSRWQEVPEKRTDWLH